MLPFLIVGAVSTLLSFGLILTIPDVTEDSNSSSSSNGETDRLVSGHTNGHANGGSNGHANGGSNGSTPNGNGHNAPAPTLRLEILLIEIDHYKHLVDSSTQYTVQYMI